MRNFPLIVRSRPVVVVFRRQRRAASRSMPPPATSYRRRLRTGPCCARSIGYRGSLWLSTSELSRNPVMHFVFAKMKLAEERGLGLKSMKTRALAAGLPLPTYTYMAPYLDLTLYRDAKAAVADLGGELLARLSPVDALCGGAVVTEKGPGNGPCWPDSPIMRQLP